MVEISLPDSLRDVEQVRSVRTPAELRYLYTAGGATTRFLKGIANKKILGESPTDQAFLREMSIFPRAIHPAVWTRPTGEKVLHVVGHARIVRSLDDRRQRAVDVEREQRARDERGIEAGDALGGKRVDQPIATGRSRCSSMRSTIRWRWRSRLASSNIAPAQR